MVEAEYPATFQCIKCKIEDEGIWRCKDCGPAAYFCMECCDEHHEVTLLHSPEQWQKEVCISLNCLIIMIFILVCP